MIRESKLKKLYHDTFEKYAAIHNSFEYADSIKVIEAFCKGYNIPLKVGGLIDNCAGQTDGKVITVNFKEDNHGFNTFIFFHEYAHMHLHYDKVGAKLSLQTKELEADASGTLMTDIIYPGNYEAILRFARDNPKVKRSITQ